MAQLFGTDGVRGKANNYPMDSVTALSIGRAVAAYFKSGTDHPRIVIGQDTRISGDMLAHAVAAGISSAGVDVDFLGVLPTPGIAHLTSKNRAVAGIVISASHNPFEDNGIKVFDGHGYKLNDDVQNALEQLISAPDDTVSVDATHIGRIGIFADPVSHYLEFLKASAPHAALDGMTIVLDCANGATANCAPELFKILGAKVVELFCKPNGININEKCGSQHPESLAKAVAEQQADLGLAFDGDGDRLIAVDETGKILSGDQIMAICAKDLLAKGLLNHRKVVSTIMSNIGFHQAMEGLGIRLYSTLVGDRYVMEKMRAEDAVLGGEDSGHIIFRDVHTTGDGLMAALKLLDAVLTSNQPLSQLAEIMTVYPQIMINVEVKAKPDFMQIPEVASAIGTAEEKLGDQGRVLVRYSGTQNQCRVMVEGPTHDLVHRLCRKIADTVQQKIG